MARHLLTLPGEIRNLIFEYALSEEKGVVYHEDEKGVGWLCLHNGARTGVADSVMITPASEEDEKEGEKKDVKREEAADSPKKKRRKLNDGSSQESENIKKASHDPTLGPQAVRGLVVANQLQFVNRQLHRETRALGLRYNDISIVDTASQMASFFNSLSVRQVYRLGTVTLRTAHGWVERPRATTQKVADGSWSTISQECPRLTIHTYSSQIRPNNGDFLKHALIIQHHGRGNTAFLQRLSSDPNMQHRLAAWVGSPTIYMDKIPPFEKWFPWDETFEEAAFRAVCLTTDQLGLMLSKSPEFDMEALVAVARDWYTNGF